ncbi:MAG: YchJ family metal-binding protein [Rhodocyclaceae bacterium]
MKAKADVCPCGNASYAACCGRYHAGEAAPNAEALMRSRYSAYVLRLSPYLLDTWHPDTRPASLDLDDDPCQWIGLQVLSHALQDDSHATVAFVARYRINGRAHRLSELSRFVKQDGRWFYVDGDTSE